MLALEKNPKYRLAHRPHFKDKISLEMGKWHAKHHTVKVMY